MADRLFRLLKKGVFRAAFAGFIVVEFALFVLLLWALSEIAPDPNYFLLGILIALTLSGPFLIGAGGYLIFQRMTRAEHVLSESERWLAERHEAGAHRINRRKVLHRRVVWIPSLAVLLFCLFLDRTWPPLSHLLHPGYERLGAYRVSMPLDWSVVFSEPDAEGDQRRSYVRARHWKGMLKSGIDEFSGRRPSLTSSSLGCDFSRFEEDHHFSPLPDRDRLVNTRKFSHGNVTLACEEFVSRDPWSAKESRTVSCVAVERDFDCSLFEADEGDVQEFCDMVRQIRKVKQGSPLTTSPSAPLPARTPS